MGKRYFRADPVRGARWVRACDEQGRVPPAPMRPGGAPPVVTVGWSEADFDRWRAGALAGQARFDAWHEAHALQDAWGLAAKHPGDEIVILP